jgi:hypothetical protein
MISRLVLGELGVWPKMSGMACRHVAAVGVKARCGGMGLVVHRGVGQLRVRVRVHLGVRASR